MPAPQKTWKERVNAKKSPKRVKLETDFAGIKAGTMLFVGTPAIIETYIRKIPSGETRTIERMRRELAHANKCEAMCPVSTAIFIRMLAEAAWDELEAGALPTAVTPFWRVVEPGTAIAKRLRADGLWIARQREAEAAVPARV
jgi:hypothetical protein